MDGRITSSEQRVQNIVDRFKGDFDKSGGEKELLAIEGPYKDEEEFLGTKGPNDGEATAGLQKMMEEMPADVKIFTVEITSAAEERVQKRLHSFGTRMDTMEKGLTHLQEKLQSRVDSIVVNERSKEDDVLESHAGVSLKNKEIVENPVEGVVHGQDDDSKIKEKEDELALVREQRTSLFRRRCREKTM